MNFSFDGGISKSNHEKNLQVKQWIYEALKIDAQIHIALSQLKCREPNCPPIETVIAVMSDPIKQYKIHKPIAEIEYTDISTIVHKQN
jgi:hypothetical protein